MRRVGMLVAAVLVATATVTVGSAPVAATDGLSAFRPVNPVRVLDTRSGIGGITGVQPAGGTVEMRLAGAGPVPGDASAVVLNVTVVDATNPGFVQAYPTGANVAGQSSNLNVPAAGATIANTVIVAVGDQGRVSFLMDAGGHLLVDVFGYFETSGATAVGRFQGLDAPTRLLDTRNPVQVPIENPGNIVNCSSFATWDEANRWFWTYRRHGDPARLDGNNNGIPCMSLPGNPGVPTIPPGLFRLAADDTFRVPMTLDAAPDGGVIPPSAAAAIVNVTAVNPAAAGFVQLYASAAGVQPGGYSNLNFAAGETAANLAIVPIGPDGGIIAYTSAEADLIIDVIGWFTGPGSITTTDGMFVPVTPQRLVDTRAGGSLTPGTTDTRNLASLAGLNRDQVAAVFVNATIVESAQPGYLQLYPTGRSTPGASSNVNVTTPGATRPNATITALDDGRVSVHHDAGGHYLIDLAGWFLAAETLVDELLAALTIAPQNTSVTYNRADWPHWIDASGNCLDTRAEVLVRDSTTTVTFNEAGCRVVTGRWVDPWTGLTFTVAADIDVDHTVALANAHRSGGWAWDTNRRRAFANDLDYPGTLRPMDRAANIAKGDKGPEAWRPPLAATWCEYATDWATIKITWELTVTTNEHAALDEMLGTC